MVLFWGRELADDLREYVHHHALRPVLPPQPVVLIPVVVSPELRLGAVRGAVIRPRAMQPHRRLVQRSVTLSKISAMVGRETFSDADIPTFMKKDATGAIRASQG